MRKRAVSKRPNRLRQALSVFESKDFFSGWVKMLDSQRIHGKMEVLFAPFSFKKKEESIYPSRREARRGMVTKEHAVVTKVPWLAAV
jgi:hypothetical protein